MLHAGCSSDLERWMWWRALTKATVAAALKRVGDNSDIGEAIGDQTGRAYYQDRMSAYVDCYKRRSRRVSESIAFYLGRRLM